MFYTQALIILIHSGEHIPPHVQGPQPGDLFCYCEVDSSLIVLKPTFWHSSIKVSASAAWAVCCSSSGRVLFPPLKPLYSSPPLLSGEGQEKSWKTIIINDVFTSAVAACDSILYKEALKTIAPSLTQKLSEATKTSARRWSFIWYLMVIKLSTNIQVCSRVSQHCSWQPQPSRRPTPGAQTQT